MAKKKAVRSKAQTKADPDIILITSPDRLKSVMDVISFFVIDVTVHVRKKALEIVATDSSRVGMVVANLNPGFFTTYHVPGAQSITINIDDLGKILKRKGKANSVELRYKLKDADKSLHVAFKTKGRAPRRFKMKTLANPASKMDADEAEQYENLRSSAEQFMDMIKKEEGIYFEILVESFEMIVKDALIVDEILQFIMDKDMKTLSISSYSEMGEQETVFDPSCEDLLEFEVEATGLVYYSVSFLENILQAKALTDVFKMKTSPERPMLIEIDIQPESDKLTTEPGNINYIIAPRVKEDFDPNADFNIEDIDDEIDDEAGAMTEEELVENLQEAG